jgi:glycosyltransferase involved in cell wall biosynthesis
MRILNVTGDAFYPQASGGVQVCLNELMLAQQAMGHAPTLLAALWGGKLANRSRVMMRLTGNPWVRHRWGSFQVYRKWHPWKDAAAIARLTQPDIVVVHGTKYTFNIAQAFSDLGLPINFYFHDVYFDIVGGDLRALRGVRFISNSAFTRDRVREKFNIDSEVIPPIFFNADAYEVATSRKNVTFINPIPLKGSDIAFSLAGLCPDIPFHFVQSWSLNAEQEKDLKDKLSRLPNVRFSRPVYDMRSVYGEAKVMLVPSQVDEAWGRVVSEAQCSGIPALFSRAGGLPEAAGDGGVCLERDAPAEDWANALRMLWRDEALYALKSRAALDHGRRLTDERAVRLAQLIARTPEHEGSNPTPLKDRTMALAS